MDMVAVLIVMGSIFVWGVVSARVTGADLSAPIVFVAVGGALAATDLVDGPSAPETLTPLVEITLVWVLFSDAARVPVSWRRRVAADPSVTTGSVAKRSPDSTFRGPSPAFAALRNRACTGPISRRCQQTRR